MGQNLQTVVIAGADASPVEVTTDGSLQVTPAPHVNETIQVATASGTLGATDQTVVAAPGSGVRIVLVGYVITTSVDATILLHYDTGTSNPILEFASIEGGGVAYHFGGYGPKGGDNEGLFFDQSTTSVIRVTAYYYTEAV